MKRPGRKFLAALAVLTALIAIYVTVERIRGKRALARYKLSLIEQGERLTVAELAPIIPVENNGATDLLRAANSLVTGHSGDLHVSRAMSIIAPGRACVAHREEAWPDSDINGQPMLRTWEEVAATVDSNQKALAEIRKALSQPHLQAGLDYTRVPWVSIQHLTPAKRAARALNGAALLHLHRGDLKAATEHLEAGLGVGRFFENEPMLISLLVRIAGDAICTATLWEALHAEGWNDEQLARLQAGWSKFNYLRGCARAVEMERAMFRAEFERLRLSRSDALEALSGFYNPFTVDDDSLVKRTAGRLPYGSKALGYLTEALPKQAAGITHVPLWQVAWSHQDELAHLRLFQQYLEPLRTTPAERPVEQARQVIDGLRRQVEETTPFDRRRFPFSTLTAPAFFKAEQRARTAEAWRSLAVTAIALKRHELRHQKLPGDLTALVPDFLESVPVDPMDGRPIRYRPEVGGGFALYSVGDDGVDDGGDARPANPESRPRLNNGRDLVWPAPASPEEIAAHDEKRRQQQR